MSASTSNSSGEKTSDGVIVAQGSLLCGVNIITDNTNDATVILYDNASAASGTKLFEGGCDGAEMSKLVWFERPVRAKNGIYLDIGGTGASAIIYTG
jgi:hypothetical protein